MYSFLLVLLVIDSIVLIAAILLQSGKGSGLAASFGGVSSSADSLLGTRQAGNLLTKASWWGGGIFLFLAFVLSLSTARSRTPKSVLDDAFTQPAPASAPAPTAGGTAPAAGGVNLTPAAPSAAPGSAPATSPAPSSSAPATPAPAKP